MEALSLRMEAGLIQPTSASLLYDPHVWERVHGRPLPPRAACLSASPSLPLDQDLSPVDLARLACDWTGAGGVVALTGQVQIVGATTCAPQLQPVPEPNPTETDVNVWETRLTVRVLSPDDVPFSEAARLEADYAATWPPHQAEPGDEVHFPPPPAHLPRLRSARVLQVRWVYRDPDYYDVLRVHTGPVRAFREGFTPLILAGAPGPHFTFTEHLDSWSFVLNRDGVLRSRVPPGTTHQLVEGALLVEGDPVEGGPEARRPPVQFWARIPRQVLRTPPVTMPGPHVGLWRAGW
jgi:hypothetical protein